MGKLNVEVYGREYALACDDGQEAHLGKLVQTVNDRIRTLSQQMGRGPENLMLIYTSLMLADEMLDAQREVAKLKKDVKGLSDGGKVVDSSKVIEMEAAMAESMLQIAERIEQIADQLEEAA